MKANQRFKFSMTMMMAVTSLAAWSGTVAAAPIVFSGYDIGSTSLAGSPNATTAAAAFDVAASVLSTIDFEAGIPAGVSATGGVIGDASVLCSTSDLHCYATSPINVYRNNGATFAFSDPMDSFGAYFTGWQLFGQTITIGYSNGGTAVLDMPAGNSAGGTLFFGFVDANASVTSITYFAGIPGSGSTDAVGIDDVRFGTAVPEPSTIGLFGFGLLVMIVISRRSVFRRRISPG